MYVFTQHDTETSKRHARTKINRDSIAIGDYWINCHGVYAPKPGHNIGKFFQIVNPFQVPYGTLVPKRVDGLLVPGAVSSSHVGFCALRMEPVWMSLGQASGLAAVQSMKTEVQLRDVDVMKPQARLHALGAKTAYLSDLGTLTKIPRPDWERGKPPQTAHLTSVPPRNPGLFSAVQFWATHGLFHDPELDGQDVGGRGHSGIGQWYTAYKGHAAGLDKPIDQAIAKRWIDRAGESFDQLDLSGFSTSGDLLQGTRGDFLIRLYHAAKPQLLPEG